MRKLGVVVTALVVLLVAVACGDGDNDENRKEAVASRERSFDRAEALFPQPEMQNFPLREALVEFAERQDRVGVVYYTYLVDMNGRPYGYFAGQTFPINACNFLSSSERIVYESTSDPVVSAPSLDGMFYGGAGSAAACDMYFFFDSTTDAMHVFKAQNFFVSDQPLNLEVPRIESVPVDE